MEETPSFAQALRPYRHAQRLTQAELAERAGLSERAISDLERGLKRPQRATVQLLVEALALARTEAERFKAAVRSRRLSTDGGSPARHNLPTALTSFVGREQAIADLQRRLDPTVDASGLPRLVTLTGAGGCGKTRLGLEVAGRLLQAFPDGVWFVDLSPLTDERQVPLAVLTELGVREAPGQPPLETLLRSVRGRLLLLVLDNCEHLVQSCAQLAAALLRGSRALRLLATSRELLRVPGEVAWRVPSLDVPELANGTDPRRVIQYEAVRLFVDRIRLVRPEFALDSANAPAAAQCAGVSTAFRWQSSSRRPVERR